MIVEGLMAMTYIYIMCSQSRHALSLKPWMSKTKGVGTAGSYESGCFRKQSAKKI